MFIILPALDDGFANTMLACCVGHEIIGKAVKVGSNIKHIKVGDRVGVGAQADSCGDCEECNNHNENHCTKAVNTYGSVYGKPKSGKSMGGYATYNRTPGHFVIAVPEGISSEAAAPMMCGVRFISVRIFRS